MKLIAWNVIFKSEVNHNVSFARLIIPRVAVIQIKRESLWALRVFDT
jgi:hypothetical protein